jgi:hypothetical protein
MNLQGALRALSLCIFFGAAFIAPHEGGILLLILVPLLFPTWRLPEREAPAFHLALYAAMGVATVEVLVSTALYDGLEPAAGMPLIVAGIIALAIPASAAGHVSSGGEMSRRSRGGLFAAFFQVFFLCIHDALVVPDLYVQYARFGLVTWVPLAYLAGILAARPAANVLQRLASAS